LLKISTPIKIALFASYTGRDGEIFALLARSLALRGHPTTDFTFQEIQSDDSYGHHSISGEALQSCYEKALAFDCVLYDSRSLVHYFADKLASKAMQINLAPDLNPADSHSYSALEKMIRIFQRLSHELFAENIGFKSKREVLKFRKNLGLPPSYERQSIPSIYGVSTHLLPKPKEYPVNSYFTGLWIDRNGGTGKINPLLFSDKKIVLIVLPKGELNLSFLEMIVRVCQNLCLQPMVAVAPEIEKEIQDLYKKGLLVIHLDTSDLIPLAHVVIHPGEVKISMECLWHGKPSLIYSTEYTTSDQRFWNDLSYVNGCSVKSITTRTVTETELIEKVNMLLSHEPILSRCHQVSELLKSEDGVERTIQLIEMRFCSQFALKQTDNHYPELSVFKADE